MLKFDNSESATQWKALLDRAKRVCVSDLFHQEQLILSTSLVRNTSLEGGGCYSVYRLIFALLFSFGRLLFVQKMSDVYGIMTTLLGSGGFSNVWLGFDKQSGEQVAIKVMNKLSCNPSEIECFKREMYIMQEVSHAACVQA